MQENTLKIGVHVPVVSQ